MFYCDECGEKNGYPVNPFSFRSLGPCECCGKRRACSDVPSSALPDPKPAKKVKRGASPAP